MWSWLGPLVAIALGHLVVVAVPVAAVAALAVIVCQLLRHEVLHPAAIRPWVRSEPGLGAEEARDGRDDVVGQRFEFGPPADPR
jgi:hypothetical protein